MDVIHRGFDGLDVSFEAQIDKDFAATLEDAKAQAAEDRADALLDHRGVKMHVAETGARGGYAYRADTGPLGATWFFKKPNARDPWGVRVSCKSAGLACFGLGATRMHLLDTLARLGVAAAEGAEAIGRVDYAVDVLAPGFALEPEAFVMHSQATRADHLDVSVHGRSSRVSSVTVGKMPGRQVIVYDKRAEVIAKKKSALVGDLEHGASGRGKAIA